MKHAALILFALGTFAAAAPEAELPAAIVIHATPDTGYYRFPGWKTAPVESEATLALDLGDSLETTLIEVVPRPGDAREFAVQFQIETSITIMDEGPHLDLVDWKHYTSRWTDLERVDTGKFRMPSFESSYALALLFPSYTVEELYEAALAVGGERWAELVRRWPDPDDGRVGVGISTVRVRVLAGHARDRETAFTLNVRVPMGC